MQIEGMTKDSLAKFLAGLRIEDVWFYENPQAIHLLLGGLASPTDRALLAITALDEGVLHVTLNASSSTGKLPAEDVPTLEEYQF